MFTWLRCSSSPSASDSPQREPLTALPPKLHLRQDSSPAVDGTPTHRPLPLDHLDSEASLQPLPPEDVERGWTDRHSFAELLMHDPRQSVLLHQGDGCAVEEEGEKMLVLPGGDFAVVGPDAHLLLQELHRLRISVAQKTRRRTAYFAGGLSLVLLGVTLWFLVETSGSLTRSGGRGRGVMRWVELAMWLTVLGLWVPVFLFLRTRRLSNLVVVGLSSAALSAFFHLGLAFASFVLSFVWSDTLSSRCDWGVDVAWTLGAKGDICDAAKEVGKKSWQAAAGVRLVVTIVFLGIWLYTLRRYNLALHTPFRISPSSLPSSELRTLLERHRADIVPLPASAHPLPPDQHGHSENWLRPMPCRQAHYALVSEGEENGMWSFVGSEHQRGASGLSALGGGENAGGGGVASWMGAKLWGGVGWLFGTPPAPTLPQDEEEKAGPAGEPVLRRSVDEHESASFVNSARPPIHRPEYAESWLSGGGEDQRSEEYRSLFDGLRCPPSISSFSLSSSHKRHSTGTATSSAPLLDRPLPVPDEADEADLPAPPPPPKDVPPRPPNLSHPTSHGSSGSSQGAIVYVRMGDGRLVRRLSTIASMSDAGASSSADLTSYSTPYHSAAPTRDGSESFATAAEVFAHHEAAGAAGGEEEVLIVDGGSGQVVDEWRRRGGAA
ncbi:hypothetical protein JCM8097_006822 [Rhodosporidiobolus ruineniae]